MVLLYLMPCDTCICHVLTSYDVEPSWIQRISVSLDGSTPETHDRFRQVEGAFEGTLRGIDLLKKVGMEFQINTTISKTTLEQIPKIQESLPDRNIY